MPASSEQDLPLVFIDTNILLDFYRSEGEAGLSLLSRISGLHDHIITSDQVEMEFLNNRQKVILGTLELIKVPGFQPVIPSYLSESKAAEKVEASLKNLRHRIKALRDRYEKVLSNPASLDPVYKSVKALAGHRGDNNLHSGSAAFEKVYLSAEKRFKRGFPPRKKTDTSFGDAINWEWIIECALRTGRDVIIVSRDSDYGMRMDGRHYLNDWLQSEFKSRVGIRRRIELTASLSDALERLDVKVTPAEKEEEERIIAEVETKPAFDVKALWSEVIGVVGRVSPFTKMYLMEGTPLGLTDGVFTLGYRKDVEHHLSLVDNSKNQTLIRTAFAALGYNVQTVKFCAIAD